MSMLRLWALVLVLVVSGCGSRGPLVLVESAQELK